MEMLQAREDLMEAIQAFLKKYDHISPKEKCMALALAEKRFLKDDDNDDDDYDEESILSINTDMFETPSPDAIMTSSPIEEPKDSIIMEDEDINTIPEKESDKDNESSAENLVQNPSESEATSDNEESISSDVNPIYDEVLEYIDGTNYLIDSIIDFSPKIDPFLEEFVDELALINPIPPRIDEVDFDPKGDIHLIKEFLYENSSPRPLEELNSKDIIKFFPHFLSPLRVVTLFWKKPIQFSLIFSFHDDFMKEKNSGSTTAHADTSLPNYDSFHFDLSESLLHLADKSDFVFEKFDDERAHIISPLEYDCYYFNIEPDPGELTRVVVEEIFGEPRVHMPNVLPTHPTICQDLDFTLSIDFSRFDLVVYFPSGNRNKTFDPGISIEVQSKRILSLNEFSISFISDPLSPVLKTLLPFSSENEDKVFNHGILVLKEEKSPHLLSH
ncbi:hypothetical protein Tco_0529397 [Tanacetum coccineum]